MQSLWKSRLIRLMALTVAFLPLVNAQAQRRAPTRPQMTRQRSGPALPTISIAVLPLQQAVGSPDTAVLGQGLADSVANALKGISRFVVADARSISNFIKVDQPSTEIIKDDEVARIGKELGVSFVVVGSYQVVANQV